MTIKGVDRLTNMVTSRNTDYPHGHDLGETLLIAVTLTADAAMDLVHARRAKHPNLDYRINGHPVN